MPGRARNHEGTEWRDKSTGRWRWRIRWDGQDYYIADTHRARAREKRDRLVAQLKKKIRVTDAQQTLTDFLSYWLEAVVRRDVTESTYHDYRKRCELYIVPSIGHYTLADLVTDTRLVRRWANATRDGYALSSARQALALLKRALQLACDERLIEFNPAAAVVIPPAQRATDDIDEDGQRALTDDQMAAVLLDVQSHDQHQTTHADKRFNQSAGMYLLYLLAFYLGLRRGELLGLRRKDIDLAAGVLRVRQQVIRLDGEHKISKTLKTKTSRRDLPLTDDLVSLLRPHLLRLGRGGDALLFAAKDGSALRPDAVTRHFARTCKRVGLAGFHFHFHDTRHTAVSRWRRSKVEAEVVAALAGHESVDVSLEVYTSVDMDRKRRAIGS